MALAAFTFLSGYFIGKKDINSIEKCFGFYRTRLMRVYPLFVISACSLYIVSAMYGLKFFSSLKQLILSLLGIVCFVMEAPLTLWYISMLLFFYLITPLLMRKKIKSKIIASGATCCFFALINYFGLDVDYRIFLYFPFYAFGLIIGSYLELSDSPHKIILALSGIMFIVLGVVEVPSTTLIYDYSVGIISLVFLMEISKVLSKSDRLSKIFENISIGSMVAYLFHRQYFGMLEKMIGSFHPLVAIGILLPVLLVLSYFVQRGYERCLKEIILKEA